jgi:WD repeat-containing protein 35
VESFGIHLNVNGTIVYGLKCEAILDRGSHDISLDHLSRVLVDVHQDSSQIMNDLLSKYQRNLLVFDF